MSSPSLQINRLIVKGELSCDITFKQGLNVIYAFSDDLRATNNAGKSTLVELIQHGLGKKQESKAKWYLNPIMDQVDILYLELQLNDDIFTIERSLRNITSAAIIRHTSYTSYIKDIPGQKIAVENMSDWFLTALDIPLVKVSTVNGRLDPLSFNLLMRAFVLNQRLSFAAILNKVQPEQRIADVIGFLTGITPLERFTLERELSLKITEVQSLELYFSSVNRFLAETSSTSLKDADDKLAQAEKSFMIAKEEQLSFQMQMRSNLRAHYNNTTGGRIENLRNQLLNLREEIAEVEHNSVRVLQEQKRLEELLNSLKTDRHKVERLRTSSFILNSVEFSACPRCLQQITSAMKVQENFGRCCLCSRPFSTTSDTIPKVAPRTEDIDLQIEEANLVLNDIFEEIEFLSVKKAEIIEKEQEVAEILDTETRTFIAPAVDQLLNYTYEVSRRETELEAAKNLHRQVYAMNNIQKNLDKNKVDRAHLEDELKQVSKINKTRLEEFRQTFENILREIDYPDLRSCIIDSQKLIPFINDTLYTNSGAAYTSLIVTCYHLALLDLARREETFFPLFLIIDSPNVYDVNETSENSMLQYLVKIANESDDSNNSVKNWQIILTTRKKVEGIDDFIQLEISRANNKMLLRKNR